MVRSDGLGTDPNATIEVSGLQDYTSVADVLFPVIEKPLSVQTDEGFMPIGKNAYFNEKNNDLLYIGNNYKPIENNLIVEASKNFENKLQFVGVRKFKQRYDFRYRIIGSEFRLGPEQTDKVINITNSFDGSVSLQIEAGLYVLVCSNGARVFDSKMTYKRKHTTEITADEIAGFIMKGIDRIENMEIDRDWSNDIDVVKSKFQELSSVFPMRKNNTLHPAVISLNGEFERNLKIYSEVKEFALFMAATNMTSRPGSYGLASSYVRPIEAISKLFLN